MISLDLLSSQSIELASLKSIVPANVKNTRPLLGVPCLARKLADSVAVIHQYDEQTKYTYLLDLAVAKQLPSKEFQVKALYVSYSVDKQVRFLTVDEQSNNTWVRSLVEALHIAQEGPVQLKVDHDAKVYMFELIEELAHFDVDENLINDELKTTFNETYFIKSLEHPFIQEALAKSDESIVVVDEEKAVTVDDTVDSKLESVSIVERGTVSSEDEFLASLDLDLPEPDLSDLSLDDLNL
ncbi:hypothetical protein [Vibrio sp. B1FLJ16]|uniref:hypothetical protein n=1 Tax=Vibrio sp. B1FLJ16 TaxID=2751178 RepID=UPI0015F486CE|nr:hypothetical protein [Vibrio sp. B1FLJ16]CAD7798508.1 hypothetical protein ACOMICROBIO_EPCKBFOG_00354 [Vibrio sp. B1FLJ16]CAE6883885.1 hypothetical protein ACOMICROBIO_EPCKBFOG_00354 [Vibrio sp. B1FLJ16]